jgi:transposase
MWGAKVFVLICWISWKDSRWSNRTGKTIEISERIKPEWEVLPKRGRVERTFGWFTGYRRLAKDFEKSIESASNVVMIAHAMVLIKRLAK